jgi:putative phage-type endonuclease
MTSVKDIVQTTGIGASEIAAVAGISDWEGPWEVYARKKELIDGPEQTEEMFWGKTFEPVIAGVFSARMDLPIAWHDKRVYSPTRPWQYASPDAFILTEPKRQILEIKTAGQYRAGEWDREAGNEDGVPEYYVAQVAWQMSVCELDLAYIAVLIGGNDFRVYKIARDPVLEEILIEEGETFWRQYLLPGVEPPLSGSRQARDYLRKRYPREREKLRPATVAETEMLAEYASVRSQLALLEERKGVLENQLTRAIGDHEGLAWERGKMTWKKARDSAKTNWEELAKEQLVGFAPDEQEGLIQQHTHVVAGSRRINFREEAVR